jgi:hypothetical protein
MEYEIIFKDSKFFNYLKYFLIENQNDLNIIYKYIIYLNLNRYNYL